MPDALIDEAARRFALLSDPTRLRILGAADPPFLLERTRPPFNGIAADAHATWFTV